VATPSKYGSSHINLSLDTAQALFTRQVPYNAEVLGLGVRSPSVSVQTTLDGRVLSADKFEKVVDEMSRVPCDKKCLLALEDECRCRCGGLNHGLWIKGATNNTCLESFVSESGPVVSDNIVKGKATLMMLVRREVVAAYTLALGSRK
jgi:hypothetical protein